MSTLNEFKAEINAKIFLLETDLENETKHHSQLHQIEMLSGEGSQSRNKINNLEGQIQALKWVLEKLINL